MHRLLFSFMWVSNEKYPEKSYILRRFYAGNMNCVYNLSIPDGKDMRLKFQSFDLASDSEYK